MNSRMNSGCSGWRHRRCRHPEHPLFILLFILSKQFVPNLDRRGMRRVSRQGHPEIQWFLTERSVMISSLLGTNLWHRYMCNLL